MSIATLTQNEGAFTTKSQKDADVITVRFSGEVDLESIDALQRILIGAHEIALAEHAKQVIIDLTQLEFMNSSGVKHFVTWLRSASQLPDATSYKIRLVASKTIPWQKRSLAALRTFAVSIVSIVHEDGAEA